MVLQCLAIFSIFISKNSDDVYETPLLALVTCSSSSESTLSTALVPRSDHVEGPVTRMVVMKVGAEREVSSGSGMSSVS